MFALGKKCPRCGGRRLEPLPARPWMHLFPGASLGNCRRCHRYVFSFFPFSIVLENRTSPRHRMPSNLLVRLHGEKEQFAKLLDISEEGVCFSYDHDLQKLAGRRFKIDIYDCKQGAYLEGLPVRIVSNMIEVQNIGGQARSILKNGGRFEKLSRTQKKLLARLIARYGNRSQKDG
ncbi:PilZ domain-containing protein [Thermodesulfobacteriota bacterium B35]